MEIFHRRRSFASLPLSERHSAMIFPKSTRYMSNAMGRFWPRFATSWVILIPVPFPVRASHASQYMCRSFAMLGSSRLLEIYCHEDDLRPFLPLQIVVTRFIQHASREPNAIPVAFVPDCFGWTPSPCRKLRGCGSRFLTVYHSLLPQPALFFVSRVNGRYTPSRQ